MNRRSAIRGASLAVFLLIVPLTQADGCSSNSGPNTSAPAPSWSPCPTNDNTESWCQTPTPAAPGPQPPAAPGKASRAAPTPGGGGVSGACHFSVKGPGADTTRGSGLKPKKVGKDSYDLAG